MDIITLSNRLEIGFQTDDPVIDEIYTELSTHTARNGSNPSIIVKGEPIKFQNEDFKTKVLESDNRIVQFGDLPETDTYSVKGVIRRQVGLLGWKVNINTNGENTIITIGYDQRIGTSPSLSGMALKYMNRSFVWRYQNLSKILLYNVLEPIIHNELLVKGSAYLHASSVEYDGKGVLFTGAGGAGKTTLMDGIVSGKSGSFVSDDLCMISDDGCLHPYFKRVQIYPYNVSGNSNSIVGDHASTGSQVQWYLRRLIKGSDGVRRRVPPEKRYEVVPVDSQIPIETAIFLQRGNYEYITLSPIEPEELSRRSVGVILEEFAPIQCKLPTITSHGSCFFNVIDFSCGTFRVYKSAFQDSRCYIAYVPNNAKIGDVRDKIYNSVLG